MSKKPDLQIPTENSFVGGLTVNLINLLRDNLRNRYQNGFPILKELIQNADDAKARTFIFGKHCGFPDSPNPLLKGTGLWFFNNGEFKENDVHGISSFGIGSKAGQSDTIGKFGLGLKSVFHLCEAFFYVAWDGKQYFMRGVNPWKETKHHDNWNAIDSGDWKRLKLKGEELSSGSNKNCAWFLLWLPLRKKAHLDTPQGITTGVIVNRFPGDAPETELQFLNDNSLTYKIAEFLPLLRHVERVEQQKENNNFAVQFSGSRLLSDLCVETAQGKIQLSNLQQPLIFTGLKNESDDTRILKLREMPAWPKTHNYDESGAEIEILDKNRPEAAVIISSTHNIEVSSHLLWTVFLPLEDDHCYEYLEMHGSKNSFVLLLHGQFFLDSGRNKIRHFESLNEPPMYFDHETLDEEEIYKTWNQLLSQIVLLPLVLPAIEQHTKYQKLSDDSCFLLTTIISQSNFFKKFHKHICREGSWLRTLNYGSHKWHWRLIRQNNFHLLRPIPKPPESDLHRPLKVFPKMSELGFILYDYSAPNLSLQKFEWQEEEIVSLLSQIHGLFRNQGHMDYLKDFLDSCGEQYLNSQLVQNELIVLIRDEILNLDKESLHHVVSKSKRLISFIRPENRLELADKLRKQDLDELLQINKLDSFLLVPKGMDAEEKGIAIPGWDTLNKYLSTLADSFDRQSLDVEQTRIKKGIEGLLNTIETEGLRNFLEKYPTCNVINVRDARSSKDKLVDINTLNRFQKSETLFRLTAGLRSNSLGITPTLVRVLLDSEVTLISINEYRKFHGNVEDLPSADDSVACLATIGKYSGQLGDFSERRAMLKKVNDPEAVDDALRGLRYLLHGSQTHRDDLDSTLWFKSDGELGTAWQKLWMVLNLDKEWSVIPDELVNVLPRYLLLQATVKEINKSSLIEDLYKIYKSPQDAPDLQVLCIRERDEVLSCIESEEVWKWLPAHTTVKGGCTSVDIEVYLAPPDFDTSDPLVGEITLVKQSENPSQADKQKKWLSSFDDKAILKVALNPKFQLPQKYWMHIINALMNLANRIPNSLLDSVKNTAWLPTEYEVPVKPLHVFDIQGEFHDEISRLLSEYRVLKETKDEKPCFALSNDIKSEVQEHKAWECVRKLFVSDTRSQNFLDQLCVLLENLPKYHIGEILEQPSDKKIQILARHNNLPGWRLLQMVANDDPEIAWERLKPSLTKPIDFEKLIGVLNFLSSEDTDWKARKSLYDIYLCQLVKQHYKKVGTQLPHISLASEAKTWCKSTMLCTRTHTHGIARKYLLDRNQDSILNNLICRNRINSREKNLKLEISNSKFEQLLGSIDNDLRCYFKPWESTLVPKPLIGAVCSLLSQSVRNLAGEYLKPHSFNWFVGELNKKWATRRDDMRGGGMSLEEALNSIRVGVTVQEKDQVEVLNILCDRIPLPLNNEPDTILAGNLLWSSTSDNSVVIPLREIDPPQLSADKLKRILLYSAECLCSDLHDQKVNLNSLWKELNKSNQLEIETARQLILENIPFYLQRFSVRNKQLINHLTAFDSLRRQLAEAETAKKNKEEIEDIRGKLRKKLEILAECIKKPKVQRTILKAVKNELKKYQYDLSSIPMELFQNADDATVEIKQFEQTVESRFAVQEWRNGIAFAHWGRPVNATLIGFNYNKQNYEKDLEKMLILSASNKTDQKSLTGKFGLGFKSVFLACEEPLILSGLLAVRIVAGMLPQPLKNEIVDKEMRRLNELGRKTNLPGTLINLPNVKDKQQVILEQFKHLAGILCIFGKAINIIEIHSSTTKTVSEWKPMQICPDVEMGNLDIEIDGSKQTKAMCIRGKHGDLLIAIGPKGYRQIPKNIPALWVTTPTQEVSHVGFVLNGNFAIDVGRGRLVGDIQYNVNKAEKIGNQAGNTLGNLFEYSRNNWCDFRSKLGLEANFSPLDFWESIWLGLTEKSLTKDVDNLPRVVVETALAKLCDFKQAIPNGLKGCLRAFSSLNDIQFHLHKLLLHEDICRELSTWKHFSKHYSGTNCVSERTANILKKTKNINLQCLEISTFIKYLEHNRVKPKDAKVLGRLYLMTKTKDHQYWKSEEVTDQLNELQFKSEADKDKWIGSKNLLTCQITSGDYDELLRHRLAPPERRLHRSYYKVDALDVEASANEFFRFCRNRMEAPAEELAKWVLNADTEKSRFNALVYLAEGDLSVDVAKLIRNKRWLKEFFPPDNFALPIELTENQRKEVRRLLGPDWDPGPPGPPLPLPIDLQTALDRLYKWWEKNEHLELTEYRKKIYPQEFQQKSEKDNSWWFMLLALGSFQSIGRTKEEHHRKFILDCRQRGWWNTFTSSDPNKAPDQWMNIIEQFIEEEDEKWTLWMSQFPRLYRLKRGLDDYKELFQSLSLFTKVITVDMILDPRNNPHLQGGGIDPPSLKRTLKVGYPFVIRELLYHRLIDETPFIKPHAYAPIRRIRRFFETFGEEVSTSPELYDILKRHLGIQKATFNGSYDIPLRIITLESHYDKHNQLFGRVIA